ncbi:IS4 family transposase [Xanthomonas campestris pv. badrii]|uniref:IS4 family transposase n=3 Tax=Xanthomonas campestris TaxID=339 RepID=A0A7Z2VBS8_XANCA|nr:IS4 family transposase [Xanthomonas campestris]QJD66428.1 IS4 family transposase [Xanthomonas campestris pv. badrii]QJD66553.1 IS4 family transposase [Xanthomonas campestris pv. badrii]QJD68035.1 IS4 family transposase [Xanthomonas campestris pv. badrii]QJD68711.1 IS4 family transposase [Xanthomonas campestris pv. badrii]QJD69332.1 IS4 family transposase [Xanthomonas campestris pv. badrii]
MSLFASALRETLPRVPDRLDQLSTLIEPAWIEQALATSGKASIRRRKLPAEHAVWLVIGLALFRDRPLWQVVQQLDLSLDAQALPAPSASVQARQRLGEEPLAELFGLLTRAWSRTPVDTQRPLRVLAVDGVVWAAPDTAENRADLGSCSNQHGPLSWPQIRATCLMDTHSHELLDAKLGGMDCGELSLAAQLQGQDHSVTLFDRAYFSAAFLLDWQAAGTQRHWLMRARDNLRHEIVEQLAPGDARIRMPVSPQARKARPELPSHWQARLIEVSVGGRLRRFITSLPCPHTHPAHALAELYRQRWEIELGFREIKQSLQEGEPVLRSKQPALVRQELWGVLIAYTLLRRWMREMAAHAKVEPQRISFHTASYAIVNLLAVPSLDSAGTLPRQLTALLAQSRHFVLPPRRTERSFPRVVKNRTSKFPTKNANQR